MVFDNQILHINLISILHPFLCSLTSLTSAVWTSVSMIACGISGLRTQNIATSGSIPSSFTGWVPLTCRSLPNRLSSHAARLLTISIKFGLSETTHVDKKQQSDQHLTDNQPLLFFFYLTYLVQSGLFAQSQASCWILVHWEIKGKDWPCVRLWMWVSLLTLSEGQSTSLKWLTYTNTHTCTHTHTRAHTHAHTHTRKSF